MKHFLLLLPFIFFTCKNPIDDLEGSWKMQSTVDYRFNFCEGKLYRDRYDQNGVLDENFAFDYQFSNDTLTINGYFNLLERKYLVEFDADTARLTEVTFNAPYTADFNLIRL